MTPDPIRRRWPLLLSLLPLLLGLAVYGQLWRGWAQGFEQTLAGWFPGQPARVTGFPYRLETELAGVTLAHDGLVSLGARIDRLRLNRGPWRPELTVAQGQGVMLSAKLPGMAPRITASAGTASLKLVAGRLERLSIVLPAASGQLGVAGDGPAFRADNLELHAREMAPAGSAAASDPRLPQRGQLVIAAEALALGQGAPISLAGDAAVRGPARLTDWQRWAAGGGSVDLVISGRDATGELFALDATLVPAGTGEAGGLRLAGTIRTVCPLAVQAALAGMAPPAEQRLRAPLVLAIETALPAAGPVSLRGLPADLASRPRRAQLPACPRLR